MVLWWCAHCASVGNPYKMRDIEREALRDHVSQRWLAVITSIAGLSLEFVEAIIPEWRAPLYLGYYRWIWNSLEDQIYCWIRCSVWLGDSSWLAGVSNGDWVLIGLSNDVAKLTTNLLVDIHVMLTKGMEEYRWQWSQLGQLIEGSQDQHYISSIQWSFYWKHMNTLIW